VCWRWKSGDDLVEFEQKGVVRSRGNFNRELREFLAVFPESGFAGPKVKLLFSGGGDGVVSEPPIYQEPDNLVTILSLRFMLPSLPICQGAFVHTEDFPALNGCHF
jgi:hypothetical protein